jgi:hypothetical protein
MTASTAVSNYGTLLKKATVTIGEITVLDPPELSNAAVEVTNHSSGGWREFIPGGLKALSPFTAEVNFTNAVTVSGMMSDTVAGTVAAYSIVFPESTTWAFNAFPTSFKPGSADAQSPDALSATVTFQPTSTGTIS